VSQIPQREWDSVRYEILSEAAELTELAHSRPEILKMLGALTRAFDRPAPVNSVYRKLQSFKAGQWSLIRNLIVNFENQSPDDQRKFDQLLVQVAALLDTADANRDVLTEALEIELAVLTTLLNELR